MRNVTIVLAVLAMATVAYGDVFTTWLPATGDFNTDANWSTGKTPYYPCTVPDADSASLGSGRTVTVSQSNDLQSFTAGAGHVILTTGDFYVRRGFSVGHNQYTYGNGTLTQTGGYMECTVNVGGDSRGNGIYTISGGSIGNGTAGSTRTAAIRVGARPTSHATESITGEFVIDESGTTTPGSIVVTSYAQVNSTKPPTPPAPSKLKVILSAVGYVTPIEVTGADYYYASAVAMSAADLEGVLSVDGSGYTNMGAEVITVDILTVTGSGALDYSGLALDAASISDGWTLGNTGKILQVSNVPEPATMCLLAVGGIGVLIRRRRK